MSPTRLLRLLLGIVLSCLLVPTQAGNRAVLRVAYAGSMGAVMDLGLGPAFAHQHAIRYQGVGQGSYALARLLAARQLQADVFISITPGPIKVLRQAGRIDHAIPIASTRMVLIYSPHSRFAKDFAAAAQGKLPWYEVLRQPGLRFGRTDPSIDPQGANALLTLQLAALYYHQQGLVKEVAGKTFNPHQLFAESSLMSRLEAGQIDATIGYASAARSHHLPMLELPAQINLGDPSMQAGWYARARLDTGRGKVLVVQPLLFYASVLKNARQPQLARAFIAFLGSPGGRRLLQAYGYAPARGATR